MHENVSRMRIRVNVAEMKLHNKSSRWHQTSQLQLTRSRISCLSTKCRACSTHRTDQFCFSWCIQDRWFVHLRNIPSPGRASSKAPNRFSVFSAIWRSWNAFAPGRKLNEFKVAEDLKLHVQTFSVFLPSWRKSSSIGRFFFDSSTSHWNLNSGNNQPMIFTQYSIVAMSIDAFPRT